MTARGMLLEAWPVTGREAVSLGELQAVSALFGLGSLDEARALLFELYRRPLTVAALETGNARAIVEALEWEDAAGPSAEEVVARSMAEARMWGEPLRVELDAAPAGEEERAQVLTVDGWMLFEEEYLPRVVTGENGHAHPEALKVQAIAARTYVQRSWRDHHALGRTVPIINSTKFQVYARTPFPSCLAAVEETRGMVGRYQGRLIVANYVAGAIWKNGRPGADDSKTEHFVTYNEGRSGRFVKPTGLASKTHPDNRGCMGQNCANWLARQGRLYPEILRYFYGADLVIGSKAGSSPPSTPPADVEPIPTTTKSSSGDAVAGLAVAAAALQWLFRGGAF